MTPVASALLLVLPYGEMDPDKVLKQVAKDTARPELALHGAPLPDPSALTDALIAHPMECFPQLSEELLADLNSAVPDEGELFVAVPYGKKPKHTLVWRYDRPKNDLARVMNVGPMVMPSEGAAKVITLVWPDAEPKSSAIAIGAVRARVGETQAGWDELIGELMEHPNECRAELSPKGVNRLLDFAEDVDGDLVVAVSPPGEKLPLLWRWDDDARELRRIFLK